MEDGRKILQRFGQPIQIEFLHLLPQAGRIRAQGGPLPSLGPQFQAACKLLDFIHRLALAKAGPDALFLIPQFCEQLGALGDGLRRNGEWSVRRP